MKLFYLARKNIIRKPSLVLPVFLLVFFTTFFVVINSIVFLSMKKGLKLSKERLGADVIVVPKGFVSAVDDSLFKGKACTVNFDSGWKDRISRIDGVAAVSTQLYVASLGNSPCCEGDAQLIAIDPENDFTVGPWIDEKGLGGMTGDEAVAGCGFGVKKGEKIKYYGREYTVKAVLDETGMGYDSSIFITFEAAKANKENPLYSSQFDFVNGDDVISMVLVKKTEDTDTEKLKGEIEKAYGKEEISVYAMSSLIGEYAKKADSISFLGHILEGGIILLAVAGILSVLVLKTVLRRNEIGTMLSLGWGMKRVIKILLLENTMVFLGGSILGSAFAAAVVFPFTALIKDMLELPYCGLGFFEFIRLAGISMATGALIMSVTVSASLLYFRKWNITQLVNDIS